MQYDNGRDLNSDTFFVIHFPTTKNQHSGFLLDTFYLCEFIFNYKHNYWIIADTWWDISHMKLFCPRFCSIVR